MKQPAEQSLYQVLEVAPTASRAEIRGSYERLRKLLGAGSLAMYSLVEPAEAQAALLQIDEAWAVLSDEAERRRYDISIGLEPAAPEAVAVPVRNSFRDAVAAIGRAGGGEAPAEATAPVAEEPAEFVLDEDDLLEVVELTGAGILVARPWGSVLGESEQVYGGISPHRAPAEEVAEPAEPAREVEAVAELPAEAGAAALPEGETDRLPPLGPDTAFTGDLLRRIRLGRGLSLDEIARRTRIGANHFANIEGERWGDLPERVFLRGYLVAYARELRLDAAHVCAYYLARIPTVRRH